MGAGMHGGFGRTSGRAASGDASFMGGSEEFMRNIRHRSDVDPGGKFDVIAHGTSRSMEIEHNGKKIKVSSRAVAQMIKRLPGYKKGQPVRLLSCSTGARSDGFAQNLANKLNVVVYAPSDTLWAYPDGKHIVAPRSKSDPSQPDRHTRGKFVKYVPGGNR